MTEQNDHTAPLTDPDTREQLHIAQVLLGGYAAVSVLTFLAILVFHGDPDVVTDAVWIRGSILAVASLVTFALGASMAKGSRRNFRRLRVVAVAQAVAIVVIEAVPGIFPIWFKIANGVCGVLLIIVAVLTVGPTLRAAFATR
jgi:hypothetical protein